MDACACTDCENAGCAGHAEKQKKTELLVC
jgi:hypothetical protein